MGGGTKLQVSASTTGSHSATHCLYDGECSGDFCCGYYDSDITYDFEVEWCPGTFHCEGYFMEDTDGDGVDDTRNDYYECDTCSNNGWELDGDAGPGEPCDWGKCALNGKRVGVDWNDHMHATCIHGERCLSKTDNDTTTTDLRKCESTYYPCIHNKYSKHSILEPCSSSYPCQNGHSSYRTTNHYYCVEHAYVGTSSTCPGLTLNPSPSSLTIHYGQASTISANPTPSSASVSFTSANSSVATVTSSGRVTGKGKGSTKITVTGVI